MRHVAAALSLLLATTACTTMTTGDDAPARAALVSPILTGADARDPWTFARPEVARVTHVALDLALDFAGKGVGGSATLDIMAAPGAKEIVLDSDALDIARITDAHGRVLPFTVGETVAGKGAPVTVAIGDARRIVVNYRAADAAALQWLAPEQTAGGRQPYLLSQGQPTLNRSWIPTQDSPGIRQTWDARITAPQPLNVVMSGLRQGEAEDLGDGRRAFRFAMDKPVAPYLIAIAAGDIAFRALGPRTGVWAEPAMLGRAADELADTEKMVSAAEALYGPYRWGRYDMIVLPPSFPYGGMENPVMTFLTPTFIAGDRSLTGLVAHELAHSWSGNLVTNANWADSWLNEGVTTYFENRIVEKLYGTKRAQQEAALSFTSMEDDLAVKGITNPITALHLPPDLAVPDGGAGGIIYDKGADFMRTVERAVGRERFDAWLRRWFDAHAFQPATSAMLLADMRANLVAGDAALDAKLMLDAWVYAPGLPANAARPDPAAFAAVDQAAQDYAAKVSLPIEGGQPVRVTLPAAWPQWTSAERQRFLQKLPEKLTGEELRELDSQLGLSTSGNNEELFLWLKLALANRYDPAVPVAERFLGTVGRRKFVAPLFQTLMDQGAWGQPIAKRIYAQTRSGYHSVTQGTVDKAVLGT